MGNRFTIDDLSLGSILVNYKHGRGEIDAKRWPRSVAYVERLHARPSGMRGAALALVIALGFACASVPPPQEVDALRREAMVHADIAALRELFADGLRYGHANGEVHAKEELLGLLGSGRLDYRAIQIEEIEARELAGSWVVTGRQTVDVTAAGRQVTSHSVFSAVYARECRHWRLVAYQATPVR